MKDVEIDVVYQDAKGNAISEEEYLKITTAGTSGSASSTTTTTTTTTKTHQANGESPQKIEPTEQPKQPIKDIDQIPEPKPKPELTEADMFDFSDDDLGALSYADSVKQVLS